MKKKPRQQVNAGRRKLMSTVAAAGGFVALAAAGVRAQPEGGEETLRFPGDAPDNRVVYQFNKAEAEYHDAVIFSVGAMLRQYQDNISIVVTAIGPGIHILLKKPQRPVSQLIREKVESLHQYGVAFHACGNTLKALKLTDKDVLPFVKVVEVGAADLMELQQQGYAYISW